MIKIGDTVEIYHDPFTKKRLEGKAVVKKIHSRYECYIDAEVEFKGDHGDIYFWAISIED